MASTVTTRPPKTTAVEEVVVVVVAVVVVYLTTLFQWGRLHRDYTASNESVISKYRAFQSRWSKATCANIINRIRMSVKLFHISISKPSYLYVRPRSRFSELNGFSFNLVYTNNKSCGRIQFRSVQSMVYMKLKHNLTSLKRENSLCNKWRSRIELRAYFP
jgi:hypothetical protein